MEFANLRWNVASAAFAARPVGTGMMRMGASRNTRHASPYFVLLPVALLSDHMNAHLSQSTHSDCFRCAAAEINFAALYEWAASLIRTTTDRPFLEFVTFTRVPKRRVRCAAVMALGLNLSPDAVAKPGP